MGVAGTTWENSCFPDCRGLVIRNVWWLVYCLCAVGAGAFEKQLSHVGVAGVFSVNLELGCSRARVGVHLPVQCAIIARLSLPGWW
jgi:hypothetical protein